MRHGKPDSGPDAGPMCKTEPQHLSSSMNEREFLADRTAEARTAIGRNLCDMKATLSKMADVRSCAARHPWILTGSAVVAGVVVGALLTPAARQGIRRTRQAPSGSATAAPPAHREQERPRTTRSFLFSIAGTVLAAVLQPLVQSWFTPPVVAPGESHGGRPPSADSAGAVATETGVD